MFQIVYSSTRGKRAHVQHYSNCNSLMVAEIRARRLLKLYARMAIWYRPVQEW